MSTSSPAQLDSISPLAPNSIFISLPKFMFFPPTSLATFLAAVALALSHWHQNLAFAVRPASSIPGATLPSVVEKPWTRTAPSNFMDTIHPHGIINSGNTCYINSVMQVLLRSEHLRRALLQPDLMAQIQQDRSQHGMQYVTIQAWTHMMWRMRNPASASSTPLDISFVRDYAVQLHPQNFVSGRQEDAVEYLSLLLQDLAQEYARARSRAMENRAAYPVRIQPRSLEELFTGLLITVNHQNRMELPVTHPFTVLDLSISDSRVQTINDALSESASISEVQRQQLVVEPPRLLLLQLHRFVSTADGKMTRLTKPIRFHDGERLMLPLYEADRTFVEYRFVGAVYHVGDTVHTGHYLSTSCYRGNCVFADDTHVFEQPAMQAWYYEHVYLLIYELHSATETETR